MAPVHKLAGRLAFINGAAPIGAILGGEHHRIAGLLEPMKQFIEDGKGRAEHALADDDVGQLALPGLEEILLDQPSAREHLGCTDKHGMESVTRAFLRNAPRPSNRRLGQRRARRKLLAWPPSQRDTGADRRQWRLRAVLAVAQLGPMASRWPGYVQTPAYLGHQRRGPPESFRNAQHGLAPHQRVQLLTRNSFAPIPHHHQPPPPVRSNLYLPRPAWPQQVEAIRRYLQHDVTSRPHLRRC